MLESLFNEVVEMTFFNFTSCSFYLITVQAFGRGTSYIFMKALKIKSD